MKNAMNRIIEALYTPWKISNALRRLAIHPWVWIIMRFNGVKWERNWRFYGIPIIQKHRNSVMRFGSGFSLRSSPYSNPLGINHPVILSTFQAGAVLEIGDNFGMTGGSICAAERIIIGNNVAVGANTTIADTDFHPLTPELRYIDPQAAKTAPVIIEDNVFVGMNCLILKGVRIGKNSVIGAGSVVTKDVPPNVIAVGNPALVIRMMP